MIVAKLEQTAIAEAPHINVSEKNPSHTRPNADRMAKPAAFFNKLVTTNLRSIAEWTGCAVLVAVYLGLYFFFGPASH